MNTQTLELDLSKDGASPALVRVGQGDERGTTIRALVFDGGAEAALSGFRAYLNVLLPTKHNYYRASASVDGNAVSVTVDESKLCSCPGYTDEAYFSFESADACYSTGRFAIEILRSVRDGQQPAQSWDDAIGEIVREGRSAVDAANAAASAAGSAADACDSIASNCKAAEAKRVAAESARVSAEASRQVKFAEWLEKYGDGSVLLEYVDDQTALDAVNSLFGGE